MHPLKLLQNGNHQYRNHRFRYYPFMENEINLDITKADLNLTTGPAGLTALKTLREEGFNAIAFERRDKVGGLWSFSNDTTYTSTLNETVCNVSKFTVSRASHSSATIWAY